MSLITSAFLTPLLLSSFASSSSEPLAEVVYSARYYFDDNRTSHFQLYTTRIDGTGKGQLTSDGSENDSPMWLDRNHIAFIKSSGEQRQNRRLCVLNTLNGNVRTLLRAKEPESLDWEDSAQKVVRLGMSFYWVTVDGVKKLKSLPGPRLFPTSYDDMTSHKVPKTTSGPAFEFQRQLAHPTDTLEDFDFEIGQFKLHLKTAEYSSTFLLSGFNIESATALSNSKIFVMTRPNFNKFESRDFPYILDLKAGTMKLLVEDASYLQLTSDRTYWLGSPTKQRQLGTLKDGKKVWIEHLYVGNVAAGKRWPIAVGNVWVGERDFRPQK